MPKIKLLFIISDRKKELEILEAVSGYGSVISQSIFCMGTAKNDILALVGLGESERILLTLSIIEDNVNKVFAILKEKFHFNESGTGVAFTVPISALAGQATMKILTGEIGGVKHERL